MTGLVDDYGRPLLSIQLTHPQTGAGVSLDAWVDTGCTAALFLPHAAVHALGLQETAMVPCRMANGSVMDQPAYQCLISWFGRVQFINVIGNAGRFPLIGLRLLENRKLTIDYPARRVQLD